MSQYFSKNTIFYNNNNESTIYNFFIMDILEVFKSTQNNCRIDHMYMNYYCPYSHVDQWRIFILSFFVSNLYISSKIDRRNDHLVSYLPKRVLLFTPSTFKIDIEKAIENSKNKTLVNECIDFLNYKMLSPPSTDGGFKFIDCSHNLTVYDAETTQPIEKTLSRHNVEFVYIDKLNPFYQIQSCRNASVLIAPHGDSLTNLIFTSSNCLICEIHIKDQPETKYSKLCKILDKKYVRYDVDDIMYIDTHLHYLVLHKRLLRIIKQHL
jgi:hypothetical protein